MYPHSFPTSCYLSLTVFLFLLKAIEQKQAEAVLGQISQLKPGLRFEQSIGSFLFFWVIRHNKLIDLRGYQPLSLSWNWPEFASPGWGWPIIIQSETCWSKASAFRLQMLYMCCDSHIRRIITFFQPSCLSQSEMRIVAGMPDKLSYQLIVMTIWYSCPIERVCGCGLVITFMVITFSWGSMVFYGGVGFDGIFPRTIIMLMFSPGCIFIAIIHVSVFTVDCNQITFF